MRNEECVMVEKRANFYSAVLFRNEQEAVAVIGFMGSWFVVHATYRQHNKVQSSDSAIFNA